MIFPGQRQTLVGINDAIGFLYPLNPISMTLPSRTTILTFCVIQMSSSASTSTMERSATLLGSTLPYCHAIDQLTISRSGSDPARDQSGCSTLFGSPNNFVPAASCRQYWIHCA